MVTLGFSIWACQDLPDGIVDGILNDETGVLFVPLDTVLLELEDVVLDTIGVVTDEGGTTVDLIVMPLEGATVGVVEGGGVPVLTLTTDHVQITF